MSRTIRRKNLTHGSRYWDHLYFLDYVAGEGYVPIDKVEEPKRWKKAWHLYHGESSHSNERGAGKGIRRMREKEFRVLIRRELHKAFYLDDYEVVINRHGLRNWWDWS